MTGYGGLKEAGTAVVSRGEGRVRAPCSGYDFAAFSGTDAVLAVGQRGRLLSPFVTVPVWPIRRRTAARDCTARPWWSTCIARTRQRTIVGPHLTVACPRGACLCTGSGTSTGDRSLLESPHGRAAACAEDRRASAGEESRIGWAESR